MKKVQFRTNGPNNKLCDPLICTTRIFVEQQINLKFLVTLKKTPKEFFQMLTDAYGEDCASSIFATLVTFSSDVVKQLTQTNQLRTLDQWKKGYIDA